MTFAGILDNDICLPGPIPFRQDCRKLKKFVTPARGVTPIKFSLQVIATPAHGIRSIKFSTWRLRRDVVIRQQCYIVVLIKGFKWKTRKYLEGGTS